MFEVISDERAALKEFMALIRTLKKNGFNIPPIKVKGLLKLYKIRYESSYRYIIENLEKYPESDNGFNEVIYYAFKNGMRDSTSGIVVSLEQKRLDELIRYIARLVGELLSVLERGIATRRYDPRWNSQIQQCIEFTKQEMKHLPFRIDTSFISSRVQAIKQHNLRSLSRDQIILFDKIYAIY